MICPITNKECKTNGCGEKCYKKDSLGYSIIVEPPISKYSRHPLCKGDGVDHCGYDTKISCDECKYGGGRKDPKAKCNQINK
jgi:hypothetical protein